MPENGPMFLFLAATIVAVFAFLSIVVWVTAPSKERQARDRMALLKTLAENPGENSMRMLDYLRELDARQAEKKEREERLGWVAGGLITGAVGVALAIMVFLLGDHGAWSVGLIPFLIGCVLFGIGMVRGNRGRAH